MVAQFASSLCASQTELFRYRPFPTRTTRACALHPPHYLPCHSNDAEKCRELATVPRVTFTVLRASDLCHKVRRHSVRVVARRYSKRQSGFFGRTGDAGRAVLCLSKSRVMKLTKNTRYLSGVLFSQAPLLDDMKYRMYKVSSEVDRLAALDDTRNTRLTYAKEMKGRTEVLLKLQIIVEFFKKSVLTLARVMGCTIPEDENKEEYKSKSRAIADSPSAHISNDVVVVHQSTLRESQYLHRSTKIATSVAPPQ